MKQILFVLTILLAAGCSKTDSIDPGTLQPYREFWADIDGVRWTPDLIIYHRTSRTSIWIYCEKHSSPAAIAFNLRINEFDSTKDKVYPIYNPTAKTGNSYIEFNPSNRKYSAISGEVRINKSNELLMGSFDAILVNEDGDDTMVVTNGHIKVTK